MYEQEIKDIQGLIREEVELSFYDEVGDGKKQFLVESIDGESLPEDIALIVDLKKHFGTGMLRGYAVTQVDFSNMYGKLEVFYCKKKKGLFGKQTLKTLNMVGQLYHYSGLESGEEQPISLREVMNK